MKMQIIKKPNFKAFGQFWKSRRKQFYEESLKLIVQDIVDGIKAGSDMTGGSFPALEPETVARKGHGRPLIDKGLLSSLGTYARTNKYTQNHGTVNIKPVYAALKSTTTGNVAQRDTPRNEVGRELQIDGIDSKSGHKKFYFFGISRDAVDTIMGLVDEIVQDSLEAM
jgi:hypothetical protein